MSNEIPDDLYKRLVLANQYNMLSFLDAENEDYWASASRKVVEGWPVEDLPLVGEIRSYLRNALTREDQRFVWDSLQVFELIQDGLSVGMKPKLENAFLSFPGFDGNKETKLLSYVRYTVEEERRFEGVERAFADFNSHAPMVEMYQNMIRVWERLGRPQFISEQLFDALIDAQALGTDWHKEF